MSGKHLVNTGYLTHSIQYHRVFILLEGGMQPIKAAIRFHPARIASKSPSCAYSMFSCYVYTVNVIIEIVIENYF